MKSTKGGVGDVADAMGRIQRAESKSQGKREDDQGAIQGIRHRETLQRPVEQARQAACGQMGREEGKISG